MKNIATHRVPTIKKLNQKGNENERFYVKHNLKPILENINNKISNLIKINDISTLTDKFIKEQIETIDLKTDENIKNESSIEYLETEQIFEKKDNTRKKKNKEKARFLLNIDPIKENNPNFINCVYAQTKSKISNLTVMNENKENHIQKKDKENFFNSPRTFDVKSMESLRKKQRSASVKEKNIVSNKNDNSDPSLKEKKVFEFDNFDFDQVSQEFVECDYVLLKKEEFLKIVGNPKQSQLMFKSIEEFKDPKKNDMEKIKHENYKFIKVLDEIKNFETNDEGVRKIEKKEFSDSKFLLEEKEKEKQERCSIF